MSTADPIDPALSIDKLPATRAAIAAKRLYLIESCRLGRSANLRDAVDRLRKQSPIYFDRVIQVHFKLTSPATAEAVALSETLDDLVAHICDLRGIAPEQLNLFSELPAPPAQYRRHL